jgi:hypothetical protein
VRFELFKDGKLIATGRQRLARVSSTAPTLSVRFNARGRQFLAALGAGSTTVRARVTTGVTGRSGLTATTTETLRGYDF